MTTTQTTFTKNIVAAHPFIDWLVAVCDREDLRWLNDAGEWVDLRPSDDLFTDAEPELADNWESLTWADQKFIIGSAADQLADIESCY